MKIKNLTFAFLLGVIIAGLGFFLLKQSFSAADESSKTDYYIITNQISRMNKMVVMEQNFGKLQKTNYSYKILGAEISNKEIMAYTQTNVQVSYDLSKMKMEVDSIGKKLIIKEIPEAEIKIRPSVEIHSIDDSFINRVDDKEIREITKKAKENAHKEVNKNELKEQGKKQLMENLNQLFVLAKALKYEIVDETGQMKIDWERL